MGWTVRPSPPANVGALFTLQRSAFVDEAMAYGTPDVPRLTETYPEFVSALNERVVLEAIADDGRVVGAICGWVEGPVGRFERLMAAPDARRRGIGSALVARIEDELERRGAARVEIDVGAIVTANIAFYERCGYARLRARRPVAFPDVELVVMGKRLRPTGR